MKERLESVVVPPVVVRVAVTTIVYEPASKSEVD